MAARRTLRLHAEFAARTGTALPELDLGGGFGIAYTSADSPATPERAGRRAAARSSSTSAPALGIAVPHLSIEPGRAISGPSTFALYRVGTVKPVQLDGGASRLYVAVDGGMSDNIRTALYAAEYSATLASRRSAAPPVLARVVGKHCEGGDILVRDEFLPADIAPGRPDRRAGLRRVQPLDGQQLQPRAAAAGGRRPGRPPRPRWSAGRPSRTCWPSTWAGCPPMRKNDVPLVCARSQTGDHDMTLDRRRPARSGVRRDGRRSTAARGSPCSAAAPSAPRWPG